MAISMDKPRIFLGSSGKQAKLLQALQLLVEYNLYDAFQLRAVLDRAYNHALDVLGIADRILIVMNADLSCIKAAFSGGDTLPAPVKARMDRLLAASGVLLWLGARRLTRLVGAAAEEGAEGALCLQPRVEASPAVKLVNEGDCRDAEVGEPITNRLDGRVETVAASAPGTAIRSRSTARASRAPGASIRRCTGGLRLSGEGCAGQAFTDSCAAMPPGR